MTAEVVAKTFIYEVVTRHSAPSKIITDQGKQFTSNLIKRMCDLLKVHKTQTAPYNPKCDGLTETFNKTLCKMLAAYSDANQTNWDLYLPLVLFAYRTREQSTTRESPFALLYGREPRLGDLDDQNLGYHPSTFTKTSNEDR
jgi:transposase-like protein